MKTKQFILIIVCGLLCIVARAADKPNILVIMGDDIGIFNLSTPPWISGLQHAQHRPHRG